MNRKGEVITVDDIPRFMTDDDLKALLLAAVESDGPQADQQIEHMLDAMPVEPMAHADGEDVANSVVRAYEQAQEQDRVLKNLLRSEAPPHYLPASDEDIAAMLDAVDAEPLARSEGAMLAKQIIQAAETADASPHRNGQTAPNGSFVRLDWLGWLNSLDLKVKAAVRLPDHSVVDELWELGRILEHPKCAAIVDRIASGVLALARKCPEFMSPRHARKILVAHSELMHRVAIKIASRLKNSHVCKVMGYSCPRVIVSPKAIRDARVLLLFDIVDSGALLRRVREGISAQHPEAITAIAILNQGDAKEGLAALCNTGKEERRPAGTPYEFVYDDLEGKSKLGEVPDTLRDEKNAKEVLNKCLEDMRRKGWIEWFEQCDAIRSDRTLGCRKYTLFFDIPKVVKQLPDCVLDESVKALDELARGPGRVIVYPATRTKRVGRLVSLLTTRLGWVAAPLGSEKASEFLFDNNGRVKHLLREFQGRALVVDCAIRTGQTLQGLSTELRNLGASDISAFYVMDALYGWVRERFERDEGIAIKSCFRLPLALPSTSKIGPMWRASFEETLRILPEMSHLSGEAKAVIRDFCCAKLKASGRTRATVEREVETKIVADATLRLQPHVELDKWLTRGDQGRGGIIKRLDINQVLRDPVIQYKLAGVVSNCAPAALKEWCVLALCTANRFDLLAENCLVAPDSPFTADTPEKWGIVPFVALNAARNDPVAAEAMRLHVRKLIETTTSGVLFPALDAGIAERVNRCRIVEEILTPACTGQ